MTGRTISSRGGSHDDGMGRSVSSAPSSAPSSASSVVSSDMAEKRSPRVAQSSTKSAAVASSSSEDFVDVRRMKSRKSVAERLDGEDFGGPGLFARPKVVNFPERLAERRRALRRRHMVRAAIVVLVVAVVSLITWSLLFSPLLRLHDDRIEVTGTNTWVSKTKVADIAGRQAGRSLLLVDAKTMEGDISELPGVTSATVTKHFPHGMTVDVQAEIPAAILRASDTSLTAVDREGRVLNAVEASVKGIPVIEVSDARRGLDDKAVQQALKILGSLDESVRRKITKVEAKTQDSVTTKLSDGYVIIWGNSSDIALKKAVVDKLLENPKQLDGAKTINVAAPDKATVK